MTISWQQSCRKAAYQDSVAAPLGHEHDDEAMLIDNNNVTDTYSDSRPDSKVW